MNTPTAEEKLRAKFYNGSFIEIHPGDLKDIKTAMIEFAKLHVEAALKAAHRNMQLPEEDVEFTLQSYPLTNIK